MSNKTTAADTMLMLEQEIVAALAGADVKSSDLSALIERTEAAIPETDQAAETARSKALDPVLSPDAKVAREAMAAAQFDRDRLHTLLPRLQERLQQIQAAEYAARWEADFEQVEGRRNELVQEYAATYPRLVAQLVDLFERIEAADKEVSRINGSAPDGENRRLRGVELTARGLASFTVANPSIASGVQLPELERSAVMAWPRPTPSLAVLVAASMSHRPHLGANWASEREERAQAMREEHERVIAHYDAMARQREEGREAAEAQKRGKGAAA
jgi:predicted transcriptional regulator